MPRRGGSGGKWVPKSSGKSSHIGKGRGRVKRVQAPASGTSFPQIRVDFTRTNQQATTPVAAAIRLPRRQRTDKRSGQK